MASSSSSRSNTLVFQGTTTYGSHKTTRTLLRVGRPWLYLILESQIRKLGALLIVGDLH